MKYYSEEDTRDLRLCMHARKVLAKKLNNPRLLQIRFHTLRHWKATVLYHQTKDILYVKEFLGHKRIDSTLKYVQLEQALFVKDARARARFLKAFGLLCWHVLSRLVGMVCPSQKELRAHHPILIQCQHKSYKGYGSNLLTER